jgi:hypothetical protein
MTGFPACELGYEFTPFPSPEEIGYQLLTVNIFSIPTEEHYDPERMDLIVFTADGNMRRMAITHPWHNRKDYQLAVGHIILRDRKAKVVEAFTCGGELQITDLPACTCCRITSPAPIFAIVSELDETANGSESSLVIELESWLARKRVKWGLNDGGYAEYLATVDPLALYAAGLQAIEHQLQTVPAKVRGDHYRRLLAQVRKAQRAPVMARLSPMAKAALEQVL